MRRLRSLFLSAMLIPCMAVAQKPATQVAIRLVDSMPQMPSPYKIKDWKSITRKQDSLLYNFNAKGVHLPLIWWDDNKVNYPIRSFGLPSYVGAGRNKSKSSTYESLPTMGSVLSASLIGIDKSKYNGHDFVTMLKQFYNTRNGANLIMNTVDRKPGSTFWYEIWPGMAFNMIVYQYPENKEIAGVMKMNAEKWLEAINGLAKGKPYPDFNYTSYDFANGKGVFNNTWHEPDAAAGLAWLEFTAFTKWKDEKFMKATKDCMAYLQNRPAKEGPFYEIMMPYGAYLAVRLNAEQGANYDELKMLNWCFDGKNSDRNGWGVMAEKWEGYDVSGLVGQKDWEQYAFAMNTYSHAAALVPVVKYNPAYSKTIGKWMLNLANASRLFYADEHPKNRQSSAIWQGDPDHVISYEGVRKDLDHENMFYVFKGVLADKGPYAIGDQVKQGTSYTDICTYGSAWVGMLAAIVDTTNVKGVLKLNCNATDFYGNNTYPSYLLYNPHNTKQAVHIDAGSSKVDIYDRVSKKFIAKNVSGNVAVTVDSDAAVNLVYLPAGTKTSAKGKTLLANNQIIDYRYK